MQATGKSVERIAITSFVTPGLPYFSIIGTTNVSDARERIKLACDAIGFNWPRTRVTVNLYPAATVKNLDELLLPIAIAIIAATGTMCPVIAGRIHYIGVLHPDGNITPVKTPPPFSDASPSNDRMPS